LKHGIWFVTLGLLACASEPSIRRLPADPTVEITAPEDGQIVRQGEQAALTFESLVDDSYTPLDELVLRWELDGELHVGAADEQGVGLWTAPDQALELGEHMLSLTVVDSDKDRATAELTYVVLGPLGAPSVEITAPDDGTSVFVGEEISFRGVASDLTTPSEDLVHVWSSNKGGPIKGVLLGEDGASVVFTDALVLGTHTVRLVVTDEDGEVGEDSISVHVVEELIETGDTGTLTPPEPEPGDLVISEMMINPTAADDDFGEWVEIYNTGSRAVDLFGYSIHDEDFDRYVFEVPLLIPGRGYVVLCASVDMTVNGGVPCNGVFRRESAGALALGNGTDEVILSRPDGVIIDRIDYNDAWFASGVALGLDPSFLEMAPNNDPGRWCNQSTVVLSSGEPGTPGAENDTCEL
jgi:hypothetical protein